MQLRIRRSMMGRDRHAEIMTMYGDRASVERAARRHDLQAEVALADLLLFDESPAQLDQVLHMESVADLEPLDLARLTTARLHVLDILLQSGPTNLSRLTEATGRDIKNISEDVDLLAEYGLLHAQRVGREKRIWALADEIDVRIIGKALPAGSRHASAAPASAG